MENKERPLNKPFPSKAKGKKFSVIIMMTGEAEKQLRNNEHHSEQG